MSTIRTALDDSRGWLLPVTEHAQLVEKSARMFSRNLGETGFPGKADGIAPEVFAIYTMERERDIHRKVILAPVTDSDDTIIEAVDDMSDQSVETQAASTDNDDPLGDIFF